VKKKYIPTVYVVDDDEAVRDSLDILLSSVGHSVACYASASAFLTDYSPQMQGCLVLDIRMSGMSGLDLQAKLNEIHALLPIIIISGHGDIPMAVQAVQAGAIDFIQKPFRDQDLLDRINEALQLDSTTRAKLEEHQFIRQKYQQLTPREKEIIGLVANGHANKVIAIDLNLSQRTVELHRANAMKKIGAQSLAHLIRMLSVIAAQ
jgi:two-component system, LuxR family, response regulator FixJ